MKLRIEIGVLVGASIWIAGTWDIAQAQTLVPDPFISPYPNLVDAFPATRAGNWRLSLHHPTLMDTNNANPPTSGVPNQSGLYEPDVVVANNFSAPANYEVTARMRTNDDDLLGLVWNYQDPDNYFRVGVRQQTGGNFGGTEGVSVQKIVGGLLTQIHPAVPGPGSPSITQAMIDNRTPFDLKVVVNGANYEVLFDGASIVSGTDPDLISGRKVGVQSWAQLTRLGTVTPFWGTEVESLAVTQGANTLFSETYSLPWRNLVMTNSAGISGVTPGTTREVLGNFGLDIDDPWVYQQSNGFLNATASSPNIDFIGPAVVVNQPGSSAFSDYEMRTRIGATDNDGVGILLRVQDDNNFYRIVFTNENTANLLRAPRGMSVQKVRNGIWSELYRDDGAPLFVYTEGADGTTPETGLPMFDVKARAVGNTLSIEVIDSFGGVINYPVIIDPSDPLLTGTVGLHTWGTDNVYYAAYGGQSGPLLVVIPEPSTWLLGVGAAFAASARRRRGRGERR